MSVAANNNPNNGNGDGDDQAFFADDFGMEIPGWILQVAPFVFFICIFWGIHKLSSRRDDDDDDISQSVWPWWQTRKRRSRKEAMDQGFAKTVDAVAKQVKSVSSSSSLSSSRPNSNNSGNSGRSLIIPLSGKYKCVMRYQDIISRHDLTSIFQNKPKPVTFYMNLKVMGEDEMSKNNNNNDGHSFLEGYRIEDKDHKKKKWNVEESHINRHNGQAYWVERCGDTRILAHGKFVNTKTFEGEWMVSDGFRGKYTEFVYVPPAASKKTNNNRGLDVIHVGVPLQLEKASLLTRLLKNMWPLSSSAKTKATSRSIETAVPLAAQMV